MPPQSDYLQDWQAEGLEQRLLQDLQKNLREAMFNHIQSFSFANIDHFSTAGLVTRMTTDVTNVQNAYMMTLRMFTRAPSMICAMVMAFAINARLASIYLVAVIILGTILFFIIRHATAYFRQAFRNMMT